MSFLKVLPVVSRKAVRVGSCFDVQCPVLMKGSEGPLAV